MFKPPVPREELVRADNRAVLRRHNYGVGGHDRRHVDLTLSERIVFQIFFNIVEIHIVKAALVAGFVDHAGGVYQAETVEEQPCLILPFARKSIASACGFREGLACLGDIAPDADAVLIAKRQVAHGFRQTLVSGFFDFRKTALGVGGIVERRNAEHAEAVLREGVACGGGASQQTSSFGKVLRTQLALAVDLRKTDHRVNAVLTGALADVFQTFRTFGSVARLVKIDAAQQEF